MGLFKYLFPSYFKNSEFSKLQAQSAYVLSVLNKEGQLEDVYNKYKKEVFRNIKEEATSGEIEIYIRFPKYLLEEHKDALISELKNSGFEVLYISDKSMIVNWEQKSHNKNK